MTTIQVRTKDDLKKKAQAVLADLGLDMSSAINMYLVQIVQKGGIPFPILTENGMTPEAEAEILRLSEEAANSDEEYSSAQELHDSIMSEV